MGGTPPGAAAPLPRVCASLPGVGGRPCTPEDFVVDEIPAYLPAGEGEHCFVRIEKRGLTTAQAIGRLAAVAGVPAAHVGSAGLKDRHAVTTQWLSFAGVEPQALASVAEDDLRVLEASRHGNKLRTGHLRGNRFRVTLRELDVAPDVALERARAIAAALREAGGMANFYGPQRFGRFGDNAERGAAMLRGEAPLPRDKRKRRLIISSLQSQIFNDVVVARLQRAALCTLLGGDVLVKRAGSAPFVSDDPSHDARRLADGEVLITGPMIGPRMLRPAEGGDARALEDAVFEGHGVTPEDFVRFGKLARGARRALVVPLDEMSIERSDDGEGLVLVFALPAGSYATVLINEVAGD